MLGAIKRKIKEIIVVPYWNYKGCFTYFDQKLFFPKNSVVFQMAVKNGIYERENLDIINAYIKPNTAVFDIGANIGLMSLPILKCNHDITLFSVEPSPNALPYLSKTHESNINIKRWTIIDKAVSDTEKKVTMKLAEGRSGAYDSLEDTKRTRFTNSVEIDCTTIDKIWKDKVCPTVSFIKIDVEGCDLLALNGGINCIKTCKPVILLEWNSTNIKAFNLTNRDFFDFFKSLDYCCYAAPVYNKVSTLTDLDLYSMFTENFLLIPN